MTDEQVRDLIRERAKGNTAAWAREHHISPQYVSDVLNGRRRPGDAILFALNLRKNVSYEPVK